MYVRRELGVFVAIALLAWQGCLATSEENSDEEGTFQGSKSTNCSCGWANKARIVGGRETRVNEFPLMAGIMGRLKIIFCGGTVITAWHVITAAHCTEPKQGEQLYVVVGEHDYIYKTETEATLEIPVEKAIEHEGYRKLGHPHDISLLVLKQKVPFSQLVGPACLPNKPINLVGQQVKVIGWGRTSEKGSGSSKLLKVNLRVVDIKQCYDKLTPFRPFIPLDPPRQLCTYGKGKDSCQGDSGGPVIWLDSDTNRYTLVGLVSFGMGCAAEKPGVNTLVSFYSGWIAAKIQETKPEGKICVKQ